MTHKKLLQQLFFLYMAASLLGCAPKRLDQTSVQQFIDQADQAFLAGQADVVCLTRSDDFTLTATNFSLAKDHIVSDLEEAERVNEQQAAYQRAKGKIIVFDHQQFCKMAFEERAFFKRASMQRSELEINVYPGGQRAVVRAHYTVKEPVYKYLDSPLGTNDQVEQQIATRQTETDDESVIVLDKEGKLKFLSTQAVSKSFHTAAERDRRL